VNSLRSSFEIMHLADLFQWIEMASKTGVCTFHSRTSTRRVYVRDGNIIACNATDPHLLLGQFLISNGRLSEDLLKTLMQIQEKTGRTLGSLILEENLLEDQELLRLVAAKAEETIYGLFDLSDVAFQFDPDREPPAGCMEVDIPVNTVIFEAAKRTDELNRARELFTSMNIVLHHTDREPDQATVASHMGKQLYESINGARTLAEIILSCRTSEYLACSFLLQLLERGLIRLGDTHEPETPAACDTDPVAKIQELMADERFAEALDLAAICNLQPGHDQYLAMLLAKAESGFIADVYRTKIPPDSIPIAIHTNRDQVPRFGMKTDDLFLLDLAEGTWSVRALTWIAPMRKVDLLRSMLKLLNAGLIQLISSEDQPGDEEQITLEASILSDDSDDLSELDRVL
jgi:hypothetical protein